MEMEMAMEMAMAMEMVMEMMVMVMEMMVMAMGREAHPTLPGAAQRPWESPVWAGTRLSQGSGKFPGSVAEEARKSSACQRKSAFAQLRPAPLPPGQFTRRSGSSPDKHIDFKIKRVPTAAAPRLEQTEMWR